MITMRISAGPLVLLAALSNPPSGSAAEAVAPLRHRLFDANHCLERISVAAQGDEVAFHWGCKGRALLTMECVLDEQGFGSGAGWHCNRPLPPYSDADGERVSDAALARAGRAMTWAACFIAPLADPSDPNKPHHGTPCYRLLLEIHQAVNRDRSDPQSALERLAP